MFEKFRPSRKAEEVQTEIITPLEGLEDRRFSIPEVDAKGNETGEHHDDWVITGEKADDEGRIKLDVSRYDDDGSIQSWHGIDHDLFMNHQAKVEAEGRVEQSRQDLGASAVRMMTIGMVNHIRNSDAFAERKAAEESASRDMLQMHYDRNTQSAQAIEEYKATKRRENPLVQMSRGKHHARR